MGAVLALARMIITYPVSGLATFLHHLHHYFFPNKTLTDTDKPQTKGMTRKVEGISNEEKWLLSARGSHHVGSERLFSRFEPVTSKSHGNNLIVSPWLSLISDKESLVRISTCRRQGMMSNSKDFDALEWRKPILNDLMEALADPNTHIIGVYGSNHEIKDGLLPKVCRRVERDMLFDRVLNIALTYKSHMKVIQDEIAGQLGINFSEKSEGKRAVELRDRIKNEQKVLIIVCDLFMGFDLGKVGIPFGADHRGCKILLASTSLEALCSNHIHAQKVLMV